MVYVTHSEIIMLTELSQRTDIRVRIYNRTEWNLHSQSIESIASRLL